MDFKWEARYSWSQPEVPRLRPGESITIIMVLFILATHLTLVLLKHILRLSAEIWAAGLARSHTAARNNHVTFTLTGTCRCKAVPTVTLTLPTHMKAGAQTIAGSDPEMEI